jgi:hypothetical protein
MTIQKSVNTILEQLEKSVAGLSNEQYTMKIDTLLGASIGEHVRHVIELFVCLQEGYASGVVNYENRKRDIAIQTSRSVSIGFMKSINQSLFCDNKVILLQAGYNENSNELLTIPTNYYREIAYNIEHAIHHMALIRIGINLISDNQVPDGYGIAPSTLKYRKSKVAW